MLHAIETAIRPAVSFTSWSKPTSVEAADRTGATSGSSAEQDAVYQPLPATDAVFPFFELGLPRVGPTLSEGPDFGLPGGPSSEAESVFAALADGVDEDADGGEELTEGVDYSGLDASWKVIPMADFEEPATEERFELLV
ncbi:MULTISPECIES: hypothetical protein [unclassified Roseovarius]|uniref:hypothetical protein n=1 Tax=unclassified Roseovarius TaxID=2614913 RepID=UPI00273F5989|nr:MULTISPECIES: hypothetical protein [unclassified Roseovarius]